MVEYGLVHCLLNVKLKNQLNSHSVVTGAGYDLLPTPIFPEIFKFFRFFFSSFRSS